MKSVGAVTNIVLVTGPSGAGRSTAINAFEDMGYETIENMPLALVPRLFHGPASGRDIALGMDVRTRDFSVKGVMDIMDLIREKEDFTCTLFYVNCSSDVLLRRFSETRRRHPLLPSDTPKAGIDAEKDLLQLLKNRADALINTSELTPHDLRDEINRLFAGESGATLAVNLQSFSYKRGVPRGIDMVLDCRFLRNPYWDESLRGKTGLDQEVRSYVQADERYDQFFDQVVNMAELLLPAYREEGKSHFTIGLGCTGGQHRSVTLTEELANTLAKKGWQVSIRHREMERRNAN
ncbi:RNase adaptor protein RapZ [Amylibacter kogurei]|uniref:RNase adaptor protein RapZ n=1 Tax=Paramylibacter kogurei TaxID=1889778 RepID=A0A2G5K2W8_9RHOB|nr:RNase adapter RapZ [Amylibacter kogurei]PIB23270.1 RNase adaptor protein RapZ [Amylibacter kogurei]